MSIATMILGESGTGKTTSLRNMNAAETLLIQTVKKPLPFRSGDCKRFDKEHAPAGNIFTTDDSRTICTLMQKTKRPVIVIDDFQYLLANEYMRRSDEKGFEKFTDIGRHAWDVLTVANQLADHVRVYILTHSQSDDFGRTRVKTIGKLLDRHSLKTVALPLSFMLAPFLYLAASLSNLPLIVGDGANERLDQYRRIVEAAGDLRQMMFLDRFSAEIDDAEHAAGALRRRPHPQRSHAASVAGRTARPSCARAAGIR